MPDRRSAYADRSTIGKTVSALVLAGAREPDPLAGDEAAPQLDWPLVNVPLIEHIRAWLSHVGIRVLTICINDAENLVRAVRDDGPAARVSVGYYEDRVPRGPAGAARDAALLTAASEYLVLEASTLPDLDLADLLCAHRSSGAAATVVARPPRGGEDDSADEPAGVYVFSHAALLRVPALGYRDIKEMLIPELHALDESVMTYAAARSWPRLDGLQSYIFAQQWMLTRMRGGALPSAGYAWHGASCVHAGARIARGARLTGSVMVGDAARIDEDAILLGPTVIGARCEVGRGAVIGRSVLWNDCRVGPGARLEECVLMHGARVETGSLERGMLCGDYVWQR